MALTKILYFKKILGMNLHFPSVKTLFNQLEKIQNAKKEIEEKLMSIKEINLDQRLLPLETFHKFAEFSQKVLSENPDFNIRRQILQKFDRLVEIGPDSVKIH